MIWAWYSHTISRLGSSGFTKPRVIFSYVTFDAGDLYSRNISVEHCDGSSGIFHFERFFVIIPASQQAALFLHVNISFERKFRPWRPAKTRERGEKSQTGKIVSEQALKARSNRQESRS